MPMFMQVCSRQVILDHDDYSSILRSSMHTSLGLQSTNINSASQVLEHVLSIVVVAFQTEGMHKGSASRCLLMESPCMSRPGQRVGEASGKRRLSEACLCFRKLSVFKNKTEMAGEKRPALLFPW